MHTRDFGADDIQEPQNDVNALLELWAVKFDTLVQRFEAHDQSLQRVVEHWTFLVQSSDGQLSPEFVYGAPPVEPFPSEFQFAFPTTVDQQEKHVEPTGISHVQMVATSSVDDQSQGRASRVSTLWKHDSDDEEYKKLEGEEVKIIACGAFNFGTRADEDLTAEVYDVKDFYKISGLAQAIARSNIFMYITLGVISANAIYLGIDVEFRRTNSLVNAISEGEWPFFVCEQFFCIYFAWEILIRFAAFEQKRNCMKDNWFRFDSALVALMVIEAWIMPVIQLTTGSEGPGLPIGPLKLLRLLRLSRLVRLMRSFPELVTIIKGMWLSARAVGSSLLMVFLLIYVFAIMLYMFITGEEGLENRFGSLPHCMWTLLLDGTLMDSPGATLSALMWKSTWNTLLSVVFFLVFVLLSAVTVMNMLIGILCEVVSAVAREERDGIETAMVKKSILLELKAHDGDDSGTINRTELGQVLTDPHSIGVLRSLDVDLEWMKAIQQKLFLTDDSEILIESVIDLILRFRGNQQCTVKHLVEVEAFNRWVIHTGLTAMNQRFSVKLQKVQKDLSSVMRSVDSICHHTQQLAPPSLPCNSKDLFL